MRKIFFIIFYLFAISSFSFAQKDSNKAHRKGFSIEPYIGLGTSESVQNGTNNLGGRIGCGLVYMFNEHWGVSSGVQVQRYSTKVISGKDSVYIINLPGYPSFWDINNVNATYKFNYLEIPVAVRYFSGVKNKMLIFTEAGFIIGHLIAAKETNTLYDTDIDTTKGTSFPNWNTVSNGSIQFNDIAPKTAYINIEGYLTLGLFIEINQRYSFVSDVSINKGLTNVGNSSNDFIYVNGLFYYYNNSNNYTPSNSNYGTNFSAMMSVRLNIKLGK